MSGRIMPSKPESMFRSNMKLERKSSIKRVQLEIKVNVSLKFNEIKPVFPCSKSITFRLNAPARAKVEDQHFTSEVYFNPNLTEKINQFQPKLHVDLSYSHLIDPDMMIVADQVIREKKCTELWLYGNQITSKGVEILSTSLRNNSTLKCLDLTYNQISDRGVQILTEALLPEQNSSLKTLYLSKNRISNEGAKYLAEMLRRNQTLTELWLSSNEISQEGIRQLANVLAYQNQTLTCFITLDEYLSDGFMY